MKKPAYITVGGQTLCKVPHHRQYGYSCNYDTMGEAKKAVRELKKHYAPAAVIAVPGKCPNYDPWALKPLDTTDLENCEAISPTSSASCTLAAGHFGPHQVGGPYNTSETFVTKCDEGHCVFHWNVDHNQCIFCGFVQEESPEDKTYTTSTGPFLHGVCPHCSATVKFSLVARDVTPDEYCGDDDDAELATYLCPECQETHISKFFED